MAIVNDDLISTYDLRQRMLLIVALSGVRPTREQMPAIQQEALRSLVEERLQLQELRRQGQLRSVNLIAADEVVNEDVAGMAREANMSVDQLAAQLGARGVSLQSLREYRRAMLSWQGFIRALYRTRVQVSPGQVDAQLQRLQENAARPQYHVHEIFLDASRLGGQEQAMFGAGQLLAQIQQGAPFNAVARQFSAAATAARGGDAGWITAADMQPEVLAVVDQLRPGQVSQPIPTRDGVYIIALEDKRAGATETIVQLKQAAIRLPASPTPEQIAQASATLADLRGRLNGCTNLEQTAGAVPGVVAGDLGETPLNELSPAFRQIAESLQPNQVSAPVQTDVGMHLVALCSRRVGGANLPSREQLEARMRGEQYELANRRLLRDLRSSATIETR